MKRWPNIDPEAIAMANRKQATVPRGATVLEPVGTAPGLVVPPGETDGAGTHAPTIVVLPGPPRELQPMWGQALETDALQAALAGASELVQRTVRLFGIPERLEVTTCLKRGEVEVVTRFAPEARDAYDALEAVIAARHPDTLFSRDGSTVDQQVAALLLAGRPGRPASPLRIATAESCTGGLLAARLTELPGSSEYFNGAVVVYANEAKAALAGVPAELIERHGAVSSEVAKTLADGARAALDADIGVGITGVAGPGGGTEQKPVGLVWVSVTLAACEDPSQVVEMTRSINLPGARADVRERATTIAMHLVRRALTDLDAPR
jgi:nicotinamide-nucleotide amidase